MVGFRLPFGRRNQKVIASFRDWRGQLVVVRHWRWYEHILRVRRHTEMVGHLEWVQQVVEDPLEVRGDAVHADTCCFYRSGLSTDPQRPFIKVVVRYPRPTWAGRSRPAEVLTAYAVDKVKAKEVRIWPL